VRLTWDSRHGIAYLRFRAKTALVETVSVTDDLNVDLAPDGTVYGIELLDANAQLRDDGARLVVYDEARGEERELPLG
jgi:uncharacterized protein YuzE